jgi:hypothetical protein
MKGAFLLVLFAVACAARPPVQPVRAAEDPADLDPVAVLGTLTGLADARLSAAAPDPWQEAAFQAALPELGELTGDPRYAAAVKTAGERRQWVAGPFALPSLALYQRDRDRRFTAPTLVGFDQLCGAR